VERIKSRPDSRSFDDAYQSSLPMMLGDDAFRCARRWSLMKMSWLGVPVRSRGRVYCTAGLGRLGRLEWWWGGAKRTIVVPHVVVPCRQALWGCKPGAPAANRQRQWSMDDDVFQASEPKATSLPTRFRNRYILVAKKAKAWMLQMNSLEAQKRYWSPLEGYPMCASEIWLESNPLTCDKLWLH